MPVTVRNADILFNDGTTQSTAAGAVTTTSVLNATAGASVGAVGTYAFLVSAVNATYGPGATLAGSNLRYIGIRVSFGDYGAVNINGWNEGPTTAGTWRCMGQMTGSTFTRTATLWLRIS